MARKPVRKTKQKPKAINLALQGGGSHGAFTWGVLDYLLEDDRVEFDGVCATSAGSINAIALAYGLTIGDRETARETLHNIWKKTSDVGQLYSPVKPMPWDKFVDKLTPATFKSSGQAWFYSLFETFTSALSPYQFNPFNINPLRKIIDETIDMNILRKCDKLKLFITATDVETGKAKVFKNEELSTDVVLASACLPFLFQAVMIKNRPYWDGGYVGNPSLWPLFYNTDTLDLCVVNINPFDRKEMPNSSYEITNRINEITFNNSLLSELRAIAFVNKLIDQDWLKPAQKNKLKNIRLHAIRADKELKNFSVASKFQTDWAYLTALRDFGRAAGKAWLDENYEALGKKATVNIKDEFLSKMEGTV